MPRGKKASLTEAVSKELKANFDLGKFKEKKMLNANAKFKPQQWIPLSQAFQDVTSIPGIPAGHIVLLRGHSDTGKTTALIEAAVSGQKRGILPVRCLLNQTRTIMSGMLVQCLLNLVTM